MTAPLANFGNSKPLFRLLMERFVGINRRRPLPKYQWLTFERWFKRHRKPAKSRRKVAYFYGCWVNYNDRRLGQRAVAILERNGIEVVVPRQQRCGIPAVVQFDKDPAPPIPPGKNPDPPPIAPGAESPCTTTSR